jgi:hypothetical protein
MTRWLQAALAAQPPHDKIDINDKNAGERFTSILSILSEADQAAFRPLPVGLPENAGCATSPADHDLWVEFEERAAILEYDGGFSRVEAERRAHAEVYGRSSQIAISDGSD